MPEGAATLVANIREGLVSPGILTVDGFSRGVSVASSGSGNGPSGVVKMGMPGGGGKGIEQVLSEKGSQGEGEEVGEGKRGSWEMVESEKERNAADEETSDEEKDALAIQTQKPSSPSSGTPPTSLQRPPLPILNTSPPKASSDLPRTPSPSPTYSEEDDVTFASVLEGYNLKSARGNTLGPHPLSPTPSGSGSSVKTMPVGAQTLPVRSDSKKANIGGKLNPNLNGVVNRSRSASAAAATTLAIPTVSQTVTKGAPLVRKGSEGSPIVEREDGLGKLGGYKDRVSKAIPGPRPRSLRPDSYTPREHHLRTDTIFSSVTVDTLASSTYPNPSDSRSPSPGVPPMRKEGEGEEGEDNRNDDREDDDLYGDGEEEEQEEGLYGGTIIRRKRSASNAGSGTPPQSPPPPHLYSPQLKRNGSGARPLPVPGRDKPGQHAHGQGREVPQTPDSGGRSVSTPLSLAL